MDVYRIVTRGGSRSAQRRSSSARKAKWINEQVQSLLEAPGEGSWHELISAPFRHKLPVQQVFSKRFLPPNWHSNAFYASYAPLTSIYEVSYYFLRERVGKKISPYPQSRLLFGVAFSDPNMIDLSSRPDLEKIMNKTDHSYSHQIVKSFPKVRSFCYPSCRDPDKKKCIVTYEISCLGKSPKSEQELLFSYDHKTQSVDIRTSTTELVGLPLTITWDNLLSKKNKF
jgi:hypothetical protein